MLILNYHRVGPPPKNARYKSLYVTPSILSIHAHILKAQGLEFVTVSEGIRRNKASNLVAITFDDGYEDNFTLGLPVLRKLKIPATVYVVTGHVGLKKVSWPESGETLPADLMTWEQLRILQDSGWEIGSHASDHVHLDRKNKTEQQEVIEQSWHDFNKHLQTTPQSFAYPYGSYNQDTLDVLRTLQCFNAVTTKESGKNTPTTSNLELFRKVGRGHSVRHLFKDLKRLWNH